MNRLGTIAELRGKMRLIPEPGGRKVGPRSFQVKEHVNTFMIPQYASLAIHQENLFFESLKMNFLLNIAHVK